MAAPTVTQRTLSDSIDKTVRMIHIGPAGDADVTATIVVDTSALTGGATGTTHTITRLVWSLSGFSVTLNFDASSDVPCFTMCRGVGDIDLKDFGGITNNAGSGITGDIEMITNGIAAADDDEDDNAGWFLIETKKVV